MTRHFDFLVLGAGAGGLSAARAAHRNGASVALINDGPPGGDCTFTGCVPSKTLIESSLQGMDFAAATERMREVITTIAATEDAETLRREGISVIDGRGTFTGRRTITVGDETFRADNVCIATGARAMIPPIPGLADVDHLTNHELFALDRLPTSMAILGGGPIGCEMAQAFCRFGTDVTIIEMADRLLGREEPEASAIIERALVADGVTVRTGVAAASVDPSAGGVTVTLADGSVVAAQHLLVAAGRRANTEGIGLDAAGVDVDRRGFVATGTDLATSAENVWAVGDVNGRSPFTHAADLMGRIAVDNAGGRRRPRTFDPLVIPRVTFTNPEVASVGVTEADAPKAARVAEIPMSANDRALTAGRTEGFVKLIAGPRRLLGNRGGGKVLGATIVGGRAGELIHEPTLAMRTGMFAGRLAQTAHAYPSWSIGVQKAASLLFVEHEGRSARPAQRQR